MLGDDVLSQQSLNLELDLPKVQMNLNLGFWLQALIVSLYGSAFVSRSKMGTVTVIL